MSEYYDWPNLPFRTLGLSDEAVLDWATTGSKEAIYTGTMGEFRFWAWCHWGCIHLAWDLKTRLNPHAHLKRLSELDGFSRHVFKADSPLQALCLIHAKAQELTPTGNTQDTIAG